MKSVKENAYAKINLCLDVLGKRTDGYHEVKMIMQSLALCDVLTIEETQTGKIELLATNEELHPDIAWDKTNLVYKAAELFCNTYEGHFKGLRIKVDKRIPSAAGLAGGSADAAAVFRALNRLYDVNVEETVLQGLGAELGADIPYCVMNGTALAEGIGEKLTVLPAAPGFFVLLVKPSADVVTGKVYKEVDNCPEIPHPHVENCLKAIREKNKDSLAETLGNRLEGVTRRLVPQVKEIEEKMLSFGAEASMMSGSGPTVFGLFEREEDIKTAKDAFLKEGYGPNVFITEFKGREE